MSVASIQPGDEDLQKRDRHAKLPDRQPGDGGRVRRDVVALPGAEAVRQLGPGGKSR
jgi:hypothetical protein